MRTQSYVFKLSRHIHFISWTFDNRICSAVSDFIHKDMLVSSEAPKQNIFIPKKIKFQAHKRWWKLQIYIWFGDFWGCCSNRQKHFASWQQREFIDHSLLSWERRQIKTCWRWSYLSFFLLHRQNFFLHIIWRPQKIYIWGVRPQQIYIYEVCGLLSWETQ